MSSFESKHVKNRFKLESGIAEELNSKIIINQLLELIQTIISRFKLSNDIETYYRIIDAVSEELDLEAKQVKDIFTLYIGQKTIDTYLDCCVTAILDTFKKKVTRRLFLRLTKSFNEISTVKMLDKLELLNNNSDQDLMELIDLEILKETSRIICFSLNTSKEIRSLEKAFLQRLKMEIDL